ncbi:MAG: PDDEXK nuclease domain-containing protein [Rhodoferax sp.]
MSKADTAKKQVASTDRKTAGRSKPGVLFPAPETLHNMPADYGEFLSNIKAIVTRERVKAVMSANVAMVLMYWDIGQSILDRQSREGWGARVIDRLAHDLKHAFPAMTGFSPRNLKYMRQFCEAWPERAIVQRTVAQLPWRSNITLLDKLRTTELRLWYAEKAIEYGMGKDMLVIQIESRLHERQGKAQNNFSVALPPSQSDMTAQIFKDPYLFDFLGTADPRREAELEQKLVDHIQQYLLELGQGFAQESNAGGVFPRWHDKAHGCSAMGTPHNTIIARPPQTKSAQRARDRSRTPAQRTLTKHSTVPGFDIISIAACAIGTGARGLFNPKQPTQS